MSGKGLLDRARVCSLAVCAVMVLAGSWTEGAQAKGGFERLFKQAQASSQAPLDRTKFKQTYIHLKQSWMQAVLSYAGESKVDSERLRRVNFPVEQRELRAWKLKQQAILPVITPESNPRLKNWVAYVESIYDHFIVQEQALRVKQDVAEGSEVDGSLFTYISLHGSKKRYKKLEWPEGMKRESSPLATTTHSDSLQPVRVLEAGGSDNPMPTSVSPLTASDRRGDLASSRVEQPPVVVQPRVEQPRCGAASS